ncbi:arrestin domain-containing protein [Aspergillus ellipticus CBS 707.79]|uniref:Arrestin domain-containing protein n=1 Tax=Aspergillus ellipticus CBS 707.79 TaxID=1448320 RepID=A0A319DM19_9EURO|nr:arrestin domain-containing protein [Aspergillus ellipticus CBS 707.79]
MILSLFRPASPPQNAPTYFDIRLADNVIWLPGEDNSHKYYHVKGNVILCLNQPLCVKDIKLHFQGHRYMNWDRNFPDFSIKHQKMPLRERLFMHQIWSFLPFSQNPTPITIPAGNHEFQFQFCLPGQSPDSSQGLDDCYIRYHLKAQIRTVKGGIFDALRPVKVCRVYQSCLLPEAQAIERVWPDKVIYRATIPSSAYTFGSAIPVKFQFIPLLKGVRVEGIHSHLMESHKAIQPILGSRCRLIVRDEYHGPDWDEFDTLSDDEGYWYCTTRILQLPKNTRGCLQSASTGFLHVKHTLNIEIRLLNPDGHASAINLTWPIFIHFAAPSSLGDGATISALRSSMLGEASDNPLPHYNDHVLDRTPDEPPPETPLEEPDNREGLPDYGHCDSLTKIPSYSTAIRSGPPSPVPFLDDDD